MKTAMQRYNEKKDRDLKIQMTMPIKTNNNLYIWEEWHYRDDGMINKIRYFAEDINGGNKMSVKVADFLCLLKNSDF